MQHDFEDEENPQNSKRKHDLHGLKMPRGILHDWFDEFNITSLVYS